MPIFKELTSNDVFTGKTALSQLIDIVQSDISGSSSRKTYNVFVTASTDPGGSLYSVTSSLFQTVYDQDYTLQVANSIFDITVGLYASGSVATTASLGTDVNGKLLFPSTSLMMREKVDMYRLHAGKLLGDSEAAFYSPFDSTTSSDRVDTAIFLDFRRLFCRDKIKRETFAMRFFTTGVLDGSGNASATEKAISNGYTGSNIVKTSVSGAVIYTDIGSSSNRRITFGGDVGDIVDSANSSNKVGLVFYDAGVAVLDAAKVMWGSQHVSGVVSAVTATLLGSNQTTIGSSSLPSSNVAAKFIPDFFVSASMEDIVDHLASCRFSSGSLTGITFQNVTNINSTMFFCRGTPDEFNYSSNPTYVDGNGRIVVVEEGQEDVQQPFSFITTVGLYDANNNLLAVAKLSRPIEKNPQKDISVRTKLDF